MHRWHSGKQETTSRLQEEIAIMRECFLMQYHEQSKWGTASSGASCQEMGCVARYGLKALLYGWIPRERHVQIMRITYALRLTTRHRYHSE